MFGEEKEYAEMAKEIESIPGVVGLPQHPRNSLLPDGNILSISSLVSRENGRRFLPSGEPVDL